MKERFINLLLETGRPEIESLITYLESTDFFKAPASSQYHGAKEGGLLEHSLAVYDNLIKIAPIYFFEYQGDTLALVALLHDICKANFYKVEMRNKKDPVVDGKQLYGWHSLPFYVIDDQLPLGHGEKSALIAMRFIQLTDEELAAIRWHMGGFGPTDYSSMQSMSKAFDKYPLAVALHMADLAACYFDKK